jgi:nucleoside diphosphate kinase
MITSRGIASNCVGTVWNAIDSSDLRVTSAKMVSLDGPDAASISSGCDVPVTSGPVVVMEILGEGAPDKWLQIRDLLREDRSVAPDSLAAALPDQDARLRDAFFSNARVSSASNVVGRLEQCTCVLILPSAVAKHQSGAILSDLLRATSAPGVNLQLTALGTYDLNRRCAEEYLEVYKHVIPDFVVRLSLWGVACILLEE